MPYVSVLNLLVQGLGCGRMVGTTERYHETILHVCQINDRSVM